MQSKILGFFAAILITTVSTTTASEFYLEVQREGSVYVFDSADAYRTWKSNGNLGQVTTRAVSAPDHQTIVFVGELAQGMYDARHLPSRRPITVLESPAVTDVAEAPGAEHKFSWKNGKTTWESPNASLSLSNHAQFRYTLLVPEDGSSTGSFRLRRMKTTLSGWMYNKALHYKLQLNWAAGRPLEDAVLAYDVSSDRAFEVTVGQYKLPFGRQWLTSGANLQFVDRAIASLEFANERDIGVMVGGETADARIVWNVGVFNGAGPNVSANDNNKYRFTGRAMFQPLGEVGFSEADFESKDTALVALGVGFDHNDKHGSNDGLDNNYTTFGLDGALKFRGMSAVGELFLRSNQLEAGTDEMLGAEFDSRGGYLQVGKFMRQQTVELAARYSRVDYDTDVADAEQEWGVALSHYWFKHNLKLQGDLRWLEDEAEGTTDRELRVQMQWLF